MRCLFTMFAEDVALLPAGSFTQLLADARHNVAHFPRFVEELWSTMAHGGFSLALRLPIPHFNGGLFEDAAGLPLTEDQLQLLIEAAQADWRDVEPAIFGTLLERALDPIERHKFGAHFTPRAYVERLVAPTVVEPLRGEWEASQAAALRLADDGKPDKALRRWRRSSGGWRPSGSWTRRAARGISSTSAWSTCCGWRRRCWRCAGSSARARCCWRWRACA